MSDQSPDLIQSTSRSFVGMKRILFAPFDIKKWFVLGFTAWLAQLLEGGGGGSGSSGGSSNSTGSGGGEGQVDQKQAGQMFYEWIQDNIEMVITVASIVVIVLVAVYVVLVWVRSRGKFMFLDNVVHNRCLVKAPWHEFREQGNSLFRWSLMLTGLFLCALLLIAGAAGWHVLGVVQRGDAWTAGLTIEVIIVGLVLLGFGIVWGYITTMLENFVVPLMYRDRVSGTEAWKKFLPVHRQAIGRFILFALWVLLLGFGVAVAAIVLGFVTCCIGFIVLMLPYVGAVLLLPASVFFRLLGPDYLGQFGPEYDVLSVAVPPLAGGDESSHSIE